jgi:hypothetical protein
MNDQLRQSVLSILEAIRAVDMDRTENTALCLNLQTQAGVWQWRIDRPADAPAVVGLFGGTGTGKSTLLNAIVGKTICHTSPIRPNTAGPILYLHRAAFQTGDPPETLFGLPISICTNHPIDPQRGQPDKVTLILHDDDRWQRFALLDCPDIDSLEESNRRVAAKLFRWLDAVLLVAIYEKLTQREYAEVFAQAAAADLFCRLVLNKVDAAEHDAIGQQAIAYLQDRSIPDPPMTVPRRPTEQLAQDPALKSIRHLLTDPKPIEQDDARWPTHLRATLLTPAKDYAVAAMQTRDRADALILRLTELLPEDNVDLSPFTAELSRSRRRSSWLYHFSIRQAVDHIGFVGRRLRSGLLGDGLPDHPKLDQSASPPQRAQQWLHQKITRDGDALYQALEDRVVNDPLGKVVFAHAPPTKLDTAEIEAALDGAVASIAGLVQQAAEQNASPAMKKVKAISKKLRLPVEHLTKLVPYLVVADLVLVGGSMAMVQGLGFAVYESANMGLSFLTDDVRRETKRISMEFNARYRRGLADQVDRFVQAINRAVPARGQLNRLASAIETVERQIGPIQRSAGEAPA